VNRNYIQSRLRPLVGQSVAPEAFEKVLTELMGFGFYESMRYEFQMRNSEPVLVVTVTEKPNGPPFINFALQGN
jgi:outer membrane protein assembly factor BamA